MRPTARQHWAVRTGPARAIFPTAPRPANRGRRTMPEACPDPQSEPDTPAQPKEAPGPGGNRKTWDEHSTRKLKVSVEANAAQRRYAGTKTDVVVAVVRGVVVAVGAARVVGVVVPGPTAQRPRSRRRAAPLVVTPAALIMRQTDSPRERRLAPAVDDDGRVGKDYQRRTQKNRRDGAARRLRRSRGAQ